AVVQSDLDGLKLLASRDYDFTSVTRHPRLSSMAREALRSGSVAKLSLLRAVRYNLTEDLAACVARSERSEKLTRDGFILVDFLGSRNIYRRPMLEFATTDYAERQIERLCSRRESLYKVPFVITAFMKAGVSLSCLMRAETCGYLLLLALASQSFNFVYILVKEAVNLKPIFELFESQFLKLTKKALNTRPN
ncbi:unnamed protein product, partial [Polarella glacialis]